MASAALLATIPGNDCAGVFGQGFENCKIPANFDPNESPIIIKFNFDGDVPGEVEINSLFPTIDGSEFAFTGIGTGTGTWTYTPGTGDPGINFFVAKGGPNFNLFDNPGDPNSDSWFTPTNPGGQSPALSHISFYDTGTPVLVPEPGSLGLLGAGLLGVAVLARRRKSKV